METLSWEGKNPDNLLTRGVKANVLTHSTLWLIGPEVKEETQQISQTQGLFTLEELGDLVASEGTQLNTVCSVASESSALIKLVRVVVLVLKFVERMKATRRPIL